MYVKILISIIFIITMTASCSSTENLKTASSGDLKNLNEKLEDIAQTYFNKKGRFYFNNDRNFVIITDKEQKKNNPLPTLKFLIYNNRNDEVIFKDTIFNGNVFWKDNHTVEVIIYPEIVMKQPGEYSIGYLLNVETGKKYSRIKK